MRNELLFLTLKVFSATGGIEKVCRVAGKAFYEYGIEQLCSVRIFSMHDADSDAIDNHYFPTTHFKGFQANKIAFVLAAIKAGCNSNIVVLSHFNLLSVGWLIKKLSPHTKVCLIAHGIELWYPLPKHKRKMLQGIDGIFSVSHFTQQTIIQQHGINAQKCNVLHNCLDPFLVTSDQAIDTDGLRQRYGIAANDAVVFTLTRLSKVDRYKGYVTVIDAMVTLTHHNQSIKYVIAGKYTKDEKQFLDQYINDRGLSQHVILTGYIPDDALAAHFKMADVYTMPSVKEGFGIVFIEAMFFGLPVIAANVDGSVDALANGSLGQLVTPHAPHLIATAVQNVLHHKAAYQPNHALLMKAFSYETYKRNWYQILQSNKN
ncbi:glycosyltransferase family 4 protein [Ferruginibacter yonginensis]|uniref:Glycosyltransferase family 4 protein n=1 Tax=Ferruginibacter yonginensis TaxID=1310416 RepID=A0ABV8QQP6_9BACT